MRLFILSALLLATLTAGQSTAGIDAGTYWQTTSFETWPLRSPLQQFASFAAPAAPAQPAAEKLTAEQPKEAAKLVTPYGAYLAAQQPQPEKLTAPEVNQVPQQPQQVPQAALGVLSPYGALQVTTTHGNLLLINSPYYAAYSLPLAYVAPSVAPAVATTASTTTSTVKPTTIAEVDDDVEDEVDTIETLQKLQAKTQTTATNDLQSDERLRAAVSRINSNYVIEEIVAVPGKHVISSQITGNSAQLKKPKAKPAKLRKGSSSSSKVRTPVKVEATGRTSTNSNNFPQIPFGTFFLPYSPTQAKAIQARKQAALILEPHSKAVVGNGGTAISTPISKALLKKGVPTNVYFNPESVAIAGVGGKAHAAADLELDLFN
ncbi:uncharacterized protein LOC132790533 isoform X3 [Drosophila nasuta]|uniref:uncharacterized protein LOC132790533 isoform X3 n=1 Tax=Drosophila nasuta TaxID=42062 RepID=UPI00295E8112|nr:uncharacterized protein LOC132790533 isoform X3 [Drosophila nasuta]